MHISGINLRREGAKDVLSADLGDFRLCYQFPPGGALNASGDAFVVAGLLAAMARGEALELDDAYTISPTLLRGLDQLEEIFSVWVPALQKVPVRARCAPPPAARDATASFFSGGVDSLYTLLEKPEIGSLLHIRGFDYRRENLPLVREIDEANARFAEARGRTFVIVESNLRDLYDALRVHVNVYHGCHLASVGLAAAYARTYVPSTLTWDELLPWGSHPVTDALWGNEAVRFVNQGADASRVDKLRRIGRDRDALELVRVCASSTAYTCGTCEKCLRTRAGLRLLGLSSSRLAPLDDLSAVRALRLSNEFNRCEWQRNHDWAVENHDRALARAIAFPLARYHVRSSLRAVDRLLLGGALGKARRRLQGVFGRLAPDTREIRIDPIG